MTGLIPSNNIEPSASIIKLFSEVQRDVTVFAPYVQRVSLEQITNEVTERVTVITSWKLHDLWVGASDISLYPYAKNNSIKLYINNRIHLKVYMADWEKCILGSSNVSRRGLGIGGEYNYELNAHHQEIDINTKLYLRRIMSESTLVDDRIYGEYLIKLAELPDPVEILEPEVVSGVNDQQLTIASLPMSYNIESLYKIYSNGFVSSDKEAVDCAMHDIALYVLPLWQNYEEFINQLRDVFFNSPFIKVLLEKIDERPLFFGETKAWIQSTCVDVPVPSRRDLTGNVQVLYRWIVDLGEGRYAVDRPNYSERLFVVNNIK